jgi:hypothetical protein
MALIKTVSPENAEGEIKEHYSFFIQRAGIVPKPFEMLSVSPELLKTHGAVVKYYMSHPTLGFPLLSHIRYLVAKEHDYQFCTNFNKQLLKMQGMDDAGISEIGTDPEKVLLEEKDKAMLLFVLKAIKDPKATEQKDIDALHNLGWTDRDIFDALAHGVNMIGSGIMMKALKMDAC